MALSGNFSTNKYSGDVGLKLSWTGTQSVANNTTTIKWTLTSEGGGSGNWWYAGPVKVTIAGQTVLNTTSRFKLYGSGAYKKTGSITVTHAENGTKSVSMSIRAAIYSTSVNCTGSATYTLNTINRYALITGTENFDDESNPTITFSNPAGVEMTTNLKARIKWTATEGGQQVEHTTPFEDIPEADWGGGQHTFSISNEDRASMRSACPTSNTLAIVYDLQSTMQGTDYHHTKTATMNIINANPTAGAVSYTEMNDSVYAITGQRSIIVQKQSTLRIKTLASTAQKAASIVSYSLNINGNDYTLTWTTGQSPDFGYVDFIQPDVAGTYTATVTTTDSRGNTSTATVDITILQWTEPSAVYKAARRQNFYPQTILNVDGTIAPITGSSMTITEKHKKTTEPETAWTQEQTLPDAQDYTITLASEDEWQIKIKVEDAFASTEYNVTIGKGIPLKFTDTYNRSFSINGLPDDEYQMFIGSDNNNNIKGHIKADDVIFPKRWGSSEHKIGYWIDGSTPVYEQTVELSSAVTAAAGNTSAAGAWTVLQTGWNDAIAPIEFFAWYTGGSDTNLWTHLSVQWERANKRLRVLNLRSQATIIDGFTIRYIKLT